MEYEIHGMCGRAMKTYSKCKIHVSHKFPVVRRREIAEEKNFIFTTYNLLIFDAAPRFYWTIKPYVSSYHRSILKMTYIVFYKLPPHARISVVAATQQ